MSLGSMDSMPVVTAPSPRPPAPVEIPDFGLDFYSISMSMPANPTLPEDINVWWDINLSFSLSMPAGLALEDTVYGTPEVDDAGSPTIAAPSGTADESGKLSTEDDKGDSTAAENLGQGSERSSKTRGSMPQTFLLIVLVGAAVAVLSAWYVKKNHQRVSSNVSQMTPASAPIL